MNNNPSSPNSPAKDEVDDVTAALESKLQLLSEDEEKELYFLRQVNALEALGQKRDSEFRDLRNRLHEIEEDPALTLRDFFDPAQFPEPDLLDTEVKRATDMNEELADELLFFSYLLAGCNEQLYSTKTPDLIKDPELDSIQIKIVRAFPEIEPLKRWNQMMGALKQADKKKTLDKVWAERVLCGGQPLNVWMEDVEGDGRIPLIAESKGIDTPQAFFQYLRGEMLNGGVAAKIQDKFRDPMNVGRVLHVMKVSMKHHRDDERLHRIRKMRVYLEGCPEILNIPDRVLTLCGVINEKGIEGHPTFKHNFKRVLLALRKKFNASH